MSDDQLLSMIEENNCTINVNASGPYGRFGSLDEVDIFCDMAEAAPNASLTGVMGGFNPGGDMAAAFELKDGLLYCKYSQGEDEEWDEEDDDDEDWDDDDDEDDDWDEEPDLDFEEIYDPIAKKVIETRYCEDEFEDDEYLY